MRTRPPEATIRFARRRSCRLRSARLAPSPLRRPIRASPALVSSFARHLMAEATKGLPLVRPNLSARGLMPSPSASSARAHKASSRSESGVGARQESSYPSTSFDEVTYPERATSTLTSPIQGLYRPKTGVRLAVAVPTTSVGFVRAERWIEFVSAVWSLGRSDAVRHRFSKSYARVSALGRTLGLVV